jgi:hypothetical protein
VRAVNCWNCKERIVLDDSFRGQEIRCQNCTSLVKVPGSGSPEDAAGKSPAETEGISSGADAPKTPAE